MGYYPQLCLHLDSDQAPATYTLPAQGDQHIVREARMAFGAMSFVTVLAPRTAASLVGKDWAAPGFLQTALER